MLSLRPLVQVLPKTIAQEGCTFSGLKFVASAAPATSQLQRRLSRLSMRTVFSCVDWQTKNDYWAISPYGSDVHKDLYGEIALTVRNSISRSGANLAASAPRRASGPTAYRGAGHLEVMARYITLATLNGSPPHRICVRGFF